MFSDPLLLAQSVKITNWLTPVWVMALGITLGFILVLLVLLKIRLMQHVPWINEVAEKRGLYLVLGIVLSLVYLGLFVGWMVWKNQYSFANMKETNTSSVWLPYVFAIPLCGLLGFGAWKLVSRRMQGELVEVFTGGFLRWLNVVCLAMATFTVVGLLLGLVNGFGVIKPVDDPIGMLKSLVRVPLTGKFSEEFVIEPSGPDDPGTELPIAFDGAELRGMEFVTNRHLEVSVDPINSATPLSRLIEVQTVNNEPFYYYQRADGLGKIPVAPVEGLYVKNLGSSPTRLKIVWYLAPTYREMVVVPTIAISVLGIYVFYLVFVALFPKVAAIAQSTFKTEVSQPLYLIVMAIGIALILGTIYIPYNTFGEDIKMYKDSGLTLIRVLAIFLAVWAASKSVAEEIEGRTALTVLSKPVGRRQFVFGKFTGISQAIAILDLPLQLQPLFQGSLFEPSTNHNLYAQQVTSMNSTLNFLKSVLKYIGFPYV